ncbi:hypothetical protein NC651_029641 [Populus alba x Populus x berolinensis]|nr:hypothetical protein NC651_029641 [Populus alba x Populus x berolinensis]
MKQWLLRKRGQTSVEESAVGSNSRALTQSSYEPWDFAVSLQMSCINLEGAFAAFERETKASKMAELILTKAPALGYMIVSLRQLTARPQSFIDKLMEPAVGKLGLKILLLGTLYYAEFNNIGQGSDTTDRVTGRGYHVVNETDAANLTMSNLIYTRRFLVASNRSALCLMT